MAESANARKKKSRDKIKAAGLYELRDLTVTPEEAVIIKKLFDKLKQLRGNDVRKII